MKYTKPEIEFCSINITDVITLSVASDEGEVYVEWPFVPINGI